MNLDELIEELNRQRDAHSGTTEVKFESLKGDKHPLNKSLVEQPWNKPRVILLKP